MTSHDITGYSPMGIPYFEAWEFPFCPYLCMGEWVYSIHNIPQNFCPTQCLVKIPNMFHRIPFCPLQNIAFQWILSFIVCASCLHYLRRGHILQLSHILPRTMFAPFRFIIWRTTLPLPWEFPSLRHGNPLSVHLYVWGNGYTPFTLFPRISAQPSVS